jgi:hypothetical protein
MSNPHPFYRFDNAWNYGFYPDNKIASNQLNAIRDLLDTWVSANAIGLPIGEVIAYCRQTMEVFNAFPYFGKFELTTNKIIDSPFWEFQIAIRNLDLSIVDASQVCAVNGYFNPTTQKVTSAYVDSFTVGSYSGTFSSAPIPVEAEVANSLSIVNQYGSAMFPLTFKYDSVTGIATSGLARAKNWTLNSNDTPVRLPSDTLPKINARRFNLNALTAEDKYCITLGEKLINYSLSETDITLVQSYFYGFTAPDGWTFSNYIDYDTYNRIYILMSRDDRSFLFIGRLDGEWLWQRFVNDQGSTDYSVFSGYSSITPLPYEPLIAYDYLIGDWYDFDFCDFTSDCYVSQEFYAMPAIPGDTWQFNVPIDSGNLTGLSSVNVGLFGESGELVQQIGSASISPTVITGLGMYGYAGARGTYSDWYDGYYSTFYPVNFQMTDCDGNVIGDVLASIPIDGLTTGDFAQFKSVVEGLAWPDYLSVEVNLDDDGKVIFTYTLTSSPICFCSITAWTYFEGSGETVYFIKPAVYEQVTFLTQFYASCTIPAVKSGCYLLGLYSENEESGWYLYSLSNIINIDTSDCFSTMLEFWSNDNSIAQGFEYFNGWKQRIRLGINGGGAKPVIEENLYRQSNGVHKRPQNKQDLSLDLHTDFLDQDTQLALVDATRHAYLVWEGKPIFVKGDIEVATIQDFTTQSSFETLAQVKFQALLQGFQPKNSSCLTC